MTATGLQIAEGVTYRFGGTVQGFKVALSVQLDGENVAQYELEGANRIRVDNPTEKAMKVKAHVNVKGVAKASKSQKVDLEFDGTFIYTCEDDELVIVE